MDLRQSNLNLPLRALAGIGVSLLALAIVGIAGWGVLALAIAGPPAVGAGLAAAFGIIALAALWALVSGRRRRLSLVVFMGSFAAVLAWYFSLAPANDRDWLAENVRLATATVDGDVVTVHNIRNFAYRSETDFTPAYYDKRFDLRRLEGVDLVASYWMGPDIAHVFLSFAFAGGDHLAISIEARKEKGEGYSTIKGFFRQYELYYVVADERDVIGLRTNHRRDPPEQVHVYRLRGSDGIEAARRLFMEYVEQINALAARPAFYNSLTTNCTTNIWLNARVNPGHLPFDWKVLASGHVPAYLYQHGRLQAGGLTFEQLQQRSLINARAEAAVIDADFSRRIRDEAGPAP